MAKCEGCHRAGVFLRTNQGLCGSCEEERQGKIEKEKDRLKEALIYSQCLTEVRDRVLHLKRALQSARVLCEYERLGYPMRPSAKGLVSKLTEKLEALDPRGPEAVSTAEGVDDWPVGTTQAGKDLPTAISGGAAEGERRRSHRKHEAYLVQLERGVRALSEDISARGVRVNAPLLQEPGARVRVTVHVPEGPVTTEGIVRWARRLGRTGNAYGRAVMGLEFSTPPSRLRSYGLGGRY